MKIFWKDNPVENKYAPESRANLISNSSVTDD